METVKLGDYNTLTVIKEVDFGLYLDGKDEGEILLPTRYVPADVKVGDELRVFIYLDQDERLIATTEHPIVKVGEFGYLRVAWVNQFGAFLDWGLMKDLFCPFSEQKRKMEIGSYHMVHVHIDEESYRIMASAKVERYLSSDRPAYQHNDAVDLLVWQKTDLGYKVIIENSHSGLIYQNQIFKPVHIGQQLKAWVKEVRDDEKIDLSLQPMGYRHVIDSAEAQVLRAMHLRGGFLTLTDNSDPAEIAEVLQMSKKTFKKAVGALYKQQRITLEDNGIRLVDEGE